MNEKPESALARKSDPFTSHAAAASVDVARLKQQVFAVLVGAGQHGATAIEIAQALGRPRDSISPRMKGLVQDGCVRYSGFTRKHGNRNSQVWVLTQYAKE